MFRILFCYLIAINIVAFVAYGMDKLRAQKHSERTPESVLLFLAAAGGTIGAWAGMQIWHHKTLHKKFRYGLPAILVVQIMLALWLIPKLW